MNDDDKKLLNNAIFDRLTDKPETDPVVIAAETQYLDDIHAGNLFVASVCADWLEENDRPELATRIRETVSPLNIRKAWQALYHREMIDSMLAAAYRDAGHPTRLAAARQVVIWQVLGLFPGWCARQVKEAADAVNSFTRTKMREDGFYHRIMPPLVITNDELDRSVFTNEPVKVLDAV